MAPKTIAVIGGLDADLIMIASRILNRGESVLGSQLSQKQDCLDSVAASGNIDSERPSGQSRTATTAQQMMTDSHNDNVRVKMIGAVGDDRYGERFIVELNKNGVDISGVVTVPDTRTSVCFVMIEETTRENRCLFTLGATATWTKDDFLTAEQLGDGIRPDLVAAQMEIDSHVVETMLTTAGNAGIDFCLNAAPASKINKRLYKHVTHLLVNKSEAAIMSGRDRNDVNQDTWLAIAQEILNRGVANVVITLGPKGAFYANAKGNGHCPAYDVKVEDTTGAGDTFTGAYTSKYLRQKEKGTWDMKSTVVRANKAVAITT
ncbi:hypothetical protein FAUST_10809 [Fusarium austroamericanum]|uniref:Carbohydrate kinase PfkB domain-containing protein n=1 Tax=Fusarium austroamericanum TaxID=282268 RepID=A0AAN5Z035_FUSAU|nr:hypothetical protein FAUST_10809 [Fusarium austroamericanum]